MSVMELCLAVSRELTSAPWQATSSPLGLPKQMLVMIDGNYHHMVSEKELTVKVTKSKNVSSFIRFENDFYDRLSCRLLFQGTG